MTAGAPTILATSMGLNRARHPWRPGPVFDYAFRLANAGGQPRLCLLATASGDEPDTIAAFYAAFEDSQVQVSHLALRETPTATSLRAHLLAQDVIWADRGNLCALLDVWRSRGLPEVLTECWQAGIVLAGESAGSMCWHSGAVTDSSGEIRPLTDGLLGLLPYANAAHYDQHERRARFHELVAQTGVVGYATDAGAGLHYEHTTLVAAISDRAKAGAYRVHRDADGRAQEESLEVRRLKRARGA